MSSYPFDFGEFSPRSLGITLNLPEALGRHLTSMAAFVLTDDNDDARRRYIKSFLDQEKDEASQFIGISYASAFIHELKHYHDYLASPFGNLIMMQHLLLLLNLFSAATYLKSESVIGIPLQAWRDLPEPLYEVYRVQNKAFSRAPPEDTAGITKYAEDTLWRIRAWHEAPPTMPNFPLTTRHLIEAAAIEVQKAQVRALFGPKRLKAFCDWLSDADKHGKYTAISDLWQKVSDNLRGASVPAGVRVALLFYALCGTIGARPDDERAHPVTRFIMVLGHICKHGKMPTEDAIMDFLDECAEANYLPTLKDALVKSSNDAKAYSESIKRIVRKTCEETETDFPDEVFDAHDSWVAAHQQMVATILRDPTAYFQPFRYIRTRDRWTAAPVYVSTTSTSLFRLNSPLFKTLQRRGWESVWGASSGDEGAEAMLYHPSLSVGIPSMARGHAQTLSTYIWMSYALWSRGMLNQAHRCVAAKFLQLDPPERVILL